MAPRRINGADNTLSYRRSREEEIKVQHVGDRQCRWHIWADSIMSRNAADLHRRLETVRGKAGKFETGQIADKWWDVAVCVFARFSHRFFYWRGKMSVRRGGWCLVFSGFIAVVLNR